jgi:hypothetical protein
MEGNKVEKALMAIGYDGKTARLVSVISATMIAVVVLSGALLGMAGRRRTTPRIIDNLFGITGFVDDSMNTKNRDIIDSGYSQMFEVHVGPDVLPARHTLIFYAHPGQDVELSLSGFWNNYQPGRRLSIPVKIDGTPLRKSCPRSAECPLRTMRLPEELASGLIKTDITECLRSDASVMMQGLHEVTIDTDSALTGIRSADRVFVRMVVLVRRTIPTGATHEKEHHENEC